jgi:hypothetical protein
MTGLCPVTSQSDLDARGAEWDSDGNPGRGDVGAADGCERPGDDTRLTWPKVEGGGVQACGTDLCTLNCVTVPCTKCSSKSSRTSDDHDPTFQNSQCILHCIATSITARSLLHKKTPVNRLMPPPNVHQNKDLSA